jgi:hypothetical protein
MYLKYQAGTGRLFIVYDNRFILRNMKKQLSSLLTNKHKNMNKKKLLNAFEGIFEELVYKATLLSES